MIEQQSGLKLRSNPPPGLVEWYENNVPPCEHLGFYDLIEEILSNRFAYRRERQGKWLIWLFTEVLYRHCDETGLGVCLLELLRHISLLEVSSDIVNRVTGFVEDLVMGEYITASKDKLIREVSRSKDTKTVDKEIEKILRSIIDLASKISFNEKLKSDGKLTEEAAEDKRFQLCLHFAELVLELSGVVSSCDRDKEILYLSNDIAPLMGAVIARPLHSGTRAIVQAIAEEAVEQVFSRMAHLSLYDENDLSKFADLAAEEASEMAIKSHLPRLRGQVVDKARKLFMERASV